MIWAKNVDLLLVGLTAQPTPYEVIQAAQLFRGRLEWFENHSWPIEDIERLRDAIGRESIVFDPDAVSSLAPVVQVTQRRSRFTDKLIDLAGRRLSEADMEKWGYRVVGLLQRLVEQEGEHRSEITPVLSGKPASLPEGEGIYTQEHEWVREHDARVVHFGEYQMVVLQVPSALDAEEVGRRSRLETGARLSLACRENDDLIALGCNDEKRHLNVLGLLERISTRVPWARVASGGDRVARLRVPTLADHPERIETLVREIVRHRSILYG